MTTNCFCCQDHCCILYHKFLASLFDAGLALTYPSSFQMLRGAVIIFTGLLSVAFLGKKLKVYEWLGMFVVLAGLIMVGVTDLLEDKGGKPLNNILTGK